MKATAKFYSNNPSSKAKKDAYNSEYNKKPSSVKKRIELNSINRKSQAAGKTRVGDGLDKAHTKNGIVNKPQSANRGSKSDSAGDKRARGKKH
jgi:hypothetical protein